MLPKPPPKASVDPRAPPNGSDEGGVLVSAGLLNEAPANGSVSQPDEDAGFDSLGFSLFIENDPNGSLDPKLGAALEVGAVLAAGLKAAAKSIVLLGACALGSPIPAKRFGFYSAAG